MHKDESSILIHYPKLIELKEDLANLDEVGVSLIRKFVEGKKSKKPYYADGLYVLYYEKNYSLSAGQTRKPNSKEGLWQSIKSEFHSLFCTDDPKYAITRKRIERASGRASAAISGAVTLAIAKAICVTFGAIVGAITVLVWAFFSVGKNAYCRLYS